MHCLMNGLKNFRKNILNMRSDGENFRIIMLLNFWKEDKYAFGMIVASTDKKEDSFEKTFLFQKKPVLLVYEVIGYMKIRALLMPI